MTELRERLDADREHSDLDRPTPERTKQNPHGVYCSECGELFYVSDDTLLKIRTAIERGLSENPFCCEACEEENREEEDTH